MSQPLLETPPFLAEHTVLGSVRGDTGKLLDVTLIRLPPSEATDLGAAFAAIEPWVKYPYPAASLAAYFAKGDNTAPMLAVQVNERTAGVVGLRLNWLCGPYIQFLGLKPGYQGLGLGSMALSWIDGQTRNANQRNLFVASSDFNSSALRFYRRHGFEPVGTLKGLVREERDEVLLHKKL